MPWMNRSVATFAAVLCLLAALSLLLVDYQAANGGQPVGDCGSLLEQEELTYGVHDRSIAALLLKQHHGNAACEDATAVQWMGVAGSLAGFVLSLALLMRPGQRFLRVISAGIAVPLVALAILDGPKGPLILVGLVLVGLAAASRSPGRTATQPP